MELLRNKATELEFKLNLEGTSASPEARLRITLSPGASLLFTCDVKDSVAHVTVPVLTSYMETLPSSLEAALEVIVDECYFEPWKEVLSVKTPMMVGVSEASSKVAAGKPMVEATSTSKPLAAKLPAARSLPRAKPDLARQFLKDTGRI